MEINAVLLVLHLVLLTTSSVQEVMISMAVLCQIHVYLNQLVLMEANVMCLVLHPQLITLCVQVVLI